MALIVTGVGSLIHVYSIGYMKDDTSYARYFAYLNLFLFFMLLLVLGRSLLVLFVGWEGVGLASYLLIGFWFEDPDKARAGKKAFITNRIGDAGFLLGMFVLYPGARHARHGPINAAFIERRRRPRSRRASSASCCSSAPRGKSAQIPLHVWLPDAMAGPTPVSALIHAATMVTAGVYLVARLSGVYLHAPEAMRGDRRRSARSPRSSRATIARRADRHQEGARVLDDLAARLHVRGAAASARTASAIFHLVHARVLQGLPVPRARAA